MISWPWSGTRGFTRTEPEGKNVIPKDQSLTRDDHDLFEMTENATPNVCFLSFSLNSCLSGIGQKGPLGIEPLQRKILRARKWAKSKTKSAYRFYINVLPDEFESSSASYSQRIENAGGSSERRSPESVCYNKLLRENSPPSPVKSHETARIGGRSCYGKLLRDLPKGMLRRGQKLYYRHTVPVDVQRLLNRREI